MVCFVRIKSKIKILESVGVEERRVRAIKEMRCIDISLLAAMYWTGLLVVLLIPFTSGSSPDTLRCVNYFTMYQLTCIWSFSSGFSVSHSIEVLRERLVALILNKEAQNLPDVPQSVRGPRKDSFLTFARQKAKERFIQRNNWRDWCILWYGNKLKTCSGIAKLAERLGPWRRTISIKSEVSKMSPEHVLQRKSLNLGSIGDMIHEESHRVRLTEVLHSIFSGLSIRPSHFGTIELGLEMKFCAESYLTRRG